MILLFGLGWVTTLRISSAEGAGFNANPQQDVIRLENRMNQLEQRLYSIENNIRVLEQ
jgi:hypothetical protein